MEIMIHLDLQIVNQLNINLYNTFLLLFTNHNSIINQIFTLLLNQLNQLQCQNMKLTNLFTLKLKNKLPNMIHTIASNHHLLILSKQLITIPIQIPIHINHLMNQELEIIIMILLLLRSYLN
jgi:hypothetical protein